MSLFIVQSDLFERRMGRRMPNAIAHGVNARGVMGKGVAKVVRDLFPACYEEYRFLCQSPSGEFRPGKVHPWSSGVGSDAQYIFNLCTQPNTGPCARLDSIDKAVGIMIDLARSVPEIRAIHMPKIGCGLGGLSWLDVRKVIEVHADSSPIDLVVHDYDPRSLR